jgi:predicted RNase H-like HicB family nuclease
MRKNSDYLKEKLQDPEYFKIYLETSVEEFKKDNDLPALLIALKNIISSKTANIKIEWSEMDQVFIARHSDFDLVATHGNTEEEALKELKFVLKDKNEITEKSSVVRKEEEFKKSLGENTDHLTNGFKEIFKDDSLFPELEEMVGKVAYSTFQSFGVKTNKHEHEILVQNDFMLKWYEAKILPSFKTVVKNRFGETKKIIVRLES